MQPLPFLQPVLTHDAVCLGLLSSGTLRKERWVLLSCSARHQHDKAGKNGGHGTSVCIIIMVVLLVDIEGMEGGRGGGCRERRLRL